MRNIGVVQSISVLLKFVLQIVITVCLLHFGITIIKFKVNSDLKRMYHMK